MGAHCTDHINGCMRSIGRQCMLVIVAAFVLNVFRSSRNPQILKQPRSILRPHSSLRTCPPARTATTNIEPQQRKKVQLNMEENCCYVYTPSPASSAHSPPPLAQTSSPRVAPQGPEQPGRVADINTAPATSYRPTNLNSSTKRPGGRAATTISPSQASTRAQMAVVQNSGSVAPESLHITALRSNTAPVRLSPSGT
jgi:hypothetical protein